MEDVVSPLGKAYNAIYQVLMELNEVMKAPDHATDHEFNLPQGSNRRSTKLVCILLQFYFFRVFRNMSAYPNALHILTLNLITVEI